MQSWTMHKLYASQKRKPLRQNGAQLWRWQVSASSILTFTVELRLDRLHSHCKVIHTAICQNNKLQIAFCPSSPTCMQHKQKFRIIKTLCIFHFVLAACSWKMSHSFIALHSTTPQAWHLCESETSELSTGSMSTDIVHAHNENLSNFQLRELPKSGSERVHGQCPSWSSFTVKTPLREKVTTIISLDYAKRKVGTTWAVCSTALQWLKWPKRKTTTLKNCMLIAPH